MNKYQNLPSISTLLTIPHPSSSSSSSPPRIIVEDVQNDLSSSRYLKSPNSYNNRLSPMLSPIDSYASSVNSISPNLNPSQPISPLPAMLSLPPLQGDDPPRRLQRHPSISSISSITSPKPSYNSLWTSPSIRPQTTPSPNHFSPQPSPQPSPNINTPSSFSSPSPTLPPTSPMMLSNTSRSNSPIIIDEEEERDPLPPSTQIVLSESGQPILKRRRGRPPSMREPALEGGWTFLTPTVWDVNNPQQQRPQTNTNTTATTNADSVMNGSMAAFTSSNMDMVLQMPRKKRGRKPKTHIVGNSCFVWKDITASRRSTKVIKEQQKAALRKLEQAPTNEL